MSITISVLFLSLLACGDKGGDTGDTGATTHYRLWHRHGCGSLGVSK